MGKGNGTSEGSPEGGVDVAHSPEAPSSPSRTQAIIRRALIPLVFVAVGGTTISAFHYIKNDLREQEEDERAELRTLQTLGLEKRRLAVQNAITIETARYAKRSAEALRNSRKDARARKLPDPLETCIAQLRTGLLRSLEQDHGRPLTAEEILALLFNGDGELPANNPVQVSSFGGYDSDPPATPPDVNCSFGSTVSFHPSRKILDRFAPPPQEATMQRRPGVGRRHGKGNR